MILISDQHQPFVRYIHKIPTTAVIIFIWKETKKKPKKNRQLAERRNVSICSVIRSTVFTSDWDLHVWMCVRSMTIINRNSSHISRRPTYGLHFDSFIFRSCFFFFCILAAAAAAASFYSMSFSVHSARTHSMCECVLKLIIKHAYFYQKSIHII